MLRRIARGGIPVLAALLGLLAVFVTPPAYAADIGVHDLETASMPAEYRQFALGSDGLDFDSIEWDDGAWMTYRLHGAAYRYPVKPDAGLTIPNVGKWTDEDGTTRQIDMRLSVKEGDVIAFLPRKGRLWWQTVHTGKEAGAAPYPDEVRSIWGTFTPADGRYGATMTASFTYHDTRESVPDTFKGVVGFNDLDGRGDQPDLLEEGVELLSGFDGAYRLKDAELAEYGTNGFSGIKRDAGDESRMNESPQILHRLTATWSGSSFTFRYSAIPPKAEPYIDPWSTFGPSVDAGDLRWTLNAKAVDKETGTVLRTWSGTVLRIGDKWSIQPPEIGGYRYAGLAAGSDALSGTETSTGLRNRLVVLEYVSNPTTMPDTGGQWPCRPYAVHRRRGRHRRGFGDCRHGTPSGRTARGLAERAVERAASGVFPFIHPKKTCPKSAPILRTHDPGHEVRNHIRPRGWRRPEPRRCSPRPPHGTCSGAARRGPAPHDGRPCWRRRGSRP